MNFCRGRLPAGDDNESEMILSLSGMGLSLDMAKERALESTRYHRCANRVPV